MTIIDFMRQKLTGYPQIADFLGGDEVHIDFTDPEPVNYGLSSTGDSPLKWDILGHQLRQHNFVLYAVGQSFTDYNRIANSNFLYELSCWLERLPEEPITFEINGEEKRGIFVKATTANAMSMGLVGDTINDGVMYQIQIYAQYKIESEE